ncbi:phosphonate transport system permease protein [Salsuginibacillus halophilus]|uniref:Phosphonate transport system permease protein n=1 Tax=Salsuginibacillus halophilus TaxID=517424 RepID=A0A2P8HWL0_9BACI|nr:phosphonate ABC transporter, permease protein PhnE [Salsuginibacillus halophilus]PSL50621.1 phosphonate transport system permease protein [Salsuginibacillus halophilus]
MASQEKQYDLTNPRRKKLWTNFTVVAVVLIALYTSAFIFTDLEYRGSGSSPGEIAFRLLIGPFMDEAALADLPETIGYMIETLAIAFAGTLVGSILAIPIGFLAAQNVSGPFSSLGKTILNGIRAFPEIMFAIIFVAAVGMGPYAGVLAITINCIGMLGKLYAEVIETIDMEIVQTLRMSGAGRIQVFWYGVLPQVLPEFSSYALYRFEIDVRSSSVLGIVGAGGIGAPLILAAQNRNWEELGMILFVIIVTVTIIDLISTNIRKRLV